MKILWKKRFLSAAFSLIFVMFLFVNVFGVKASADTGPKPSIELTIENPPSELYYVALFSEVGGFNDYDFIAPWISEDVVKVMTEANDDGYILFISPCADNIFESNEEHVYDFTYMVPSNYKVAILTGSGKLYFSEAIDREEFNAKVTFDFQSMELTERKPEIAVGRFKSSILCYLVTLLIEGIIFLIMRYPLKKRNVLSFLAANTVTQAILNYLLIVKGIWTAGPETFKTFLFTEIGIMVAEGIFYVFMLYSKDGKRKPVKNFIYSIVANVFSVVAGFIIVLVYYYYTHIV